MQPEELPMVGMMFPSGVGPHGRATLQEFLVELALDMETTLVLEPVNGGSQQLSGLAGLVPHAAANLSSQFLPGQGCPALYQALDNMVYLEDCLYEILDSMVVHIPMHDPCIFVSV